MSLEPTMGMNIGDEFGLYGVQSSEKGAWSFGTYVDGHLGSG